MSCMCKNTCPIYNATQHKIHTPVNNNIPQNYSRSFGSVVLFRNMALRIFAPNMEEVTGHQRKVCDKGIHTVFSSQHTIRILKLGMVKRMGMFLTSEKWEICNICAVQQDTQSSFMIEFCSSHMLARHVSDLTGPSLGAFVYRLYVQIWYVVIRVLLDTYSRYEVVGRTNAPKDGPVRSETCRANICDE